MLYVFGTGEVPISISGDPVNQDSLAHTVRAVGPVTQVITHLQRGDVLGVRGPFGSSWPVEAAQGCDVVMVAGGLGLAPLRPALYHVLAHREKFGEVVLLYGARSPGDVLYSRQLDRLRRQGAEIMVTVDRVAGAWPGEVGVVTRLIPRATFDPLNTVAMICGPEIMMRFTIAELEKLGVSQENIFISMERNMKCAVGFCGHCQFGPTFVCKDGPVFSCSQVKRFFWTKEV
jgi:NAD(P)H-flavin reductase